MTRIDGHALWVNKIARQISGYIENSEITAGGEVINNCVFIDNAMSVIKNSITKPNEIDITRYIRNGLRQTVSAQNFYLGGEQKQIIVIMTLKRTMIVLCGSGK